MHEIITNLHMHTTYSDGSGTHKDIAQAALEAGIDVVIVTDHNILVSGMDGYTSSKERRVLMLVGEEIHNPYRQPQKSHLLVFGVNRELAPYAAQIQRLVDTIQKAEGLCFIAHPYDRALKAFGETDITWEDWDVRGYTGIELWNGMSEMKEVIHSKLDGIFYAFFPQYLARGPQPDTLKKWDDLIGKGQRVVAVGGSDAHAMKMSLGPLRRTIYPYTYHFQAVNTHLLMPGPLTGNLASDRAAVYDALRRGHAFIGYDYPAPTRGFRFTAQGKDTTAVMGDEIRVGNGVTLQIRLPSTAECRLVCNGDTVQVWRDQQVCTHIAAKPGAYRVECTLEYLGRRRGWIYSNPIYIRS